MTALLAAIIFAYICLSTGASWIFVITALMGAIIISTILQLFFLKLHR